MINLNNICYQYGKNGDVITGISYHFCKGYLYLVRGENGVGKTTLVRIMLGLLPPRSGSVEMSKKNIVSYLPDDNGIYDNLSVIQNIRFRLGLYNTPYKQMKNEVERRLKQFGIFEYRDRLVNTLSYGTKKKVAIICASIVPADLLVFDEPTNGLDLLAVNEFRKLLLELMDNKRTIICVSHDLQVPDKCPHQELSLSRTKLSSLLSEGDAK